MLIGALGEAELVKWEPSARQEKWGDAMLVTLAKVRDLEAPGVIGDSASQLSLALC